MAPTVLGSRDPIFGTTTARMLDVSQARMHQVQDQLERHRLIARPPGGWMPQVVLAARFRWPSIAPAGIAEVMAFFAV